MVDRDISTVEPFVESVPQLMLIVGLWMATEGCIGPGIKIFPDEDRWFWSFDDALWWASLATSSLSATFAIARFLKVECSRKKMTHFKMDFKCFW